MAVYVMGDPHLSLSVEKPMDIFEGWHDYMQRIQENWTRVVGPEDTVVVAGDVSWGMSLQQSLADFRLLENLPGKKILLKGNHDYWWTTKAKMERFFEENDLHTLQILHNNCIEADGICICGSRGWIFEQGEPQDKKVMAREAGRLDTSLKAAEGKEGEKIAFLHYPPIFGDQLAPEIFDVLLAHKVRRCYYGHIHGAARAYAFQGEYLGIKFRLISADQLGFTPELVPRSENLHK